MKTKLAIFLTLVLILSGCAGSDNDVHPEKTFRIVEIENCQYVFVSRRPFGSEMAMAHKGNCNNPIHICGKSNIE